MEGPKHLLSIVGCTTDTEVMSRIAYPFLGDCDWYFRKIHIQLWGHLLVYFCKSWRHVLNRIMIWAQYCSASLKHQWFSLIEHSWMHATSDLLSSSTKVSQYMDNQPFHSKVHLFSCMWKRFVQCCCPRLILFRPWALHHGGALSWRASQRSLKSADQWHYMTITGNAHNCSLHFEV